MILSPRISSSHRIAIERAQMEAPVNVVRLAKDLGLRVFVEALPQKISGKLYPDKESPASWSISVNRGDIPQRQRFTVAHEIGHYLLHLDYAKNGITDDTFYRSSLTSKQEAEANFLPLIY